jgi:PAS domain S-box-containing protein
VGTLPDRPPSVLDRFPGLEHIARSAADVIVVTDLDRRVAVWNAASEDLYGIPATTAVGRVIEDLVFSTIVGLEPGGPSPRDEAIRDGSWRGRVIDRPKLGDRTGRELVVEVVLSPLVDEAGATVGVLSIKRDITQSVQLEHELTTLGSLATTTESARTRSAITEGALDLLMRSSGASVGLVLSHEDGRIRVEAARDIPRWIREWVERPGRTASPLTDALRQPGTVISGPLDALPVLDEVRARGANLGIAALSAVGLHKQGELVGMLVLGFAEAERRRPSNATLIQAAIHVQRALEQARLVEELEARAASERRLVDRQVALQSLTALSDSSDELAVLAERTIEQVATVLGAVAGTYTLLDQLGSPIDTFSWKFPDDMRAGVAASAMVGDGPVLRRFDRSSRAEPDLLDLAHVTGWVGYAALPIIVTGRLEGILVAFFERDPEALGLDGRALTAIARMASISLGNFRLRERLLASEKRYRTLFESSPEPYLVESIDGTIVDANDAAASLFHGDVASLRGIPIEAHVRVDAAEAMRRRDTLRRRGRGTFPGVGVRLDGTTFPQEALAAIVELDGDERVLVHIRDLTDRDRLQQELIQAQKMEAIGQLVSGVAHELNNPLAAILLACQVIQRDPRLPDDMKHSADLLVDEATRTRKIVQNLLDFARQRAPERHPTSIRTLVDAILLLQSYSLAQSGIEVDIDIPDDLPEVELDRAQIQQVLINLTQNAIYSIRTSGGGRMSLRAAIERRRDGRWLRFSVGDDGGGVAPADVPRLFVPFFTTKSSSDGTGLGLPVSYGIVVSHGGDLVYEPGPNGRGATFTFELPVRSESDASVRPPTVVLERSAQTEEAAPPRQGRRVLVLDDEASIRMLLERWLRGSGYVPVTASTGADAIRLAREERFDVVLCDHRMAGMDGIEVYRAITAAEPRLARRFVFMSGDVLNEQLQAFVREHGIGLLAKPFDLETVERTIRRVVPGDDAVATEPQPAR